MVEAGLLLAGSVATFSVVPHLTAVFTYGSLYYCYTWYGKIEVDKVIDRTDY
jgi:hypothetical protein